MVAAYMYDIELCTLSSLDTFQMNHITINNLI